MNITALTLRRSLESFAESNFYTSPDKWTTYQYDSTYEYWYYPFLTIVIYVISIYGIQYLMKSRAAFGGPIFTSILFTHNMLLSIGSLFLCIFYLTTILSYRELDNKTNHQIFCELLPSESVGTLEYLYYINLLVKYYELIDTVFIVLKKKPIIFLHVYHHPCTLVFAYVIRIEKPGMEWTTLVLNLIVHTVMYFYYAMSSIKVRLPYKIIITLMQITQFILDLICVWYVVFNYYLYNGNSCTASLTAGGIATWVLVSYLCLFLDFFRSTYSKKNKKIQNNNSKKKL